MLTSLKRKLRVVFDSVGIELEISAQAFRKKLRVYEVPISYDGRTYEEGKKINWWDGLIAIYWLL